MAKFQQQKKKRKKKAEQQGLWTWPQKKAGTKRKSSEPDFPAHRVHETKVKEGRKKVGGKEGSQKPKTKLHHKFLAGGQGPTPLNKARAARARDDPRTTTDRP